MSESVYARACRIELEASAISYEAEKAVPIRYRGRLITTQRIDLVVNQRLILEVKSVDRIHPVHVAQAVSYLRATYLRIALVVNFNVPVLKQGIRRVVLSWFVDKIPSCSSCLRDEQLPLSSGWPGLGLLPVLFQLLEV
jgi:GxxExxY protein